MMKVIFWIGLFLFVGSIILIITKYDELNVQCKGILVKMRIEKIPKTCWGTKWNHFITLSYNEKTYIKQIPAGYCETHHVGELIDIRFLRESSTILFPNESVLSNLLALFAIGFIGLIMSWYQWKKMKKKKRY